MKLLDGRPKWFGVQTVSGGKLIRTQVFLVGLLFRRHFVKGTFALGVLLTGRLWFGGFVRGIFAGGFDRILFQWKQVSLQNYTMSSCQLV